MKMVKNMNKLIAKNNEEFKHAEEFKGVSESYIDKLLENCERFIANVNERKEEKKMKYYTTARETGTIIDEFETEEDAMKAIEEYEKEDISNDCYEEDFYEIEMK